ncbi:hypothetical protein, partial [Bradyrhizobium brasilense]|uniref:hypothetical protein n=1 Tax=Bradyrhizobium brasilense TaxID=1419277 RepID=UPI001E558127
MVVFVSSFMARVQRNLEWADQARGTAKASIAFPQRLKPAFFPCREVGGIPRGRQKSRLVAVLRWRCGPDGCGPIAPRA